jgi:hypothetical protein
VSAQQRGIIEGPAERRRQAVAARRAWAQTRAATPDPAKQNPRPWNC